MKEWPKNKNVAVILNVMYEAWEDGVAPGVSPMGNPIKPGYRDQVGISWGEYAGNCGMDRLLKVYRETGVKGSVCVSGLNAVRHPETVKQINDEGHEIVLHGWAQNILPVYLDKEEERRQVKASVDAIAAACGRKPLGLLSPRVTNSPNSCEVLAEEGLKFNADDMGHDVPFEVKTPSGSVVMVPFTSHINDLLYFKFGQYPGEYLHRLQGELEWFANHPEEKGVIWAVCHAHVFGRPFGAGEYAKAIEYLKAQPNVWLAQPSEVVATAMDGVDYWK